METKKNESANLEGKRPKFMLLGLIFGSAVALLAFEYQVRETKDLSGSTKLWDPNELIAQEIVPVVRQKKKEVLPKPKKQIVDQFKIDNLNTSTDEEPVDVEPLPEQPDVPDNVDLIPEIVPEPEVWTSVEEMPFFPGGDAGLLQHLAREIKYPAPAMEANIQGVVFVQFVVNEIGEIEQVKLLKGIGGGCDEEALRVIKNLPSWTPGLQRGKPVKVQFSVPVRFKLQ